MNKKVLLVGGGVVSSLIALYAGATAWSGKQAEVRYREYLGRIQAEAPFLRVAAQSYRHGFFTATGSTTYEIGCAPAAGGTAPTIVIASTVHHGPFADGSVGAAVVDTQISLGGSEGARLSASFGGPPVSVRTVVAFGGNATSTIKSSAAKIPLSDGVELDWQGLAGTIESGIGTTPFAYHLTSPGLALADTAHGFSARIAGFDVQATGAFIGGASRLSTGKVQGTAQAVELSAAMPLPSGGTKAVKVSMTGLRFDSEASISGELMTLASGFSGAALVDETRIDRFDMKASMKRLHAPTYERMLNRLANSAPGCAPAGKETTPAMLIESLDADLMALARFDPEIALDKLTIDHAGGHGEFSYSFGLSGVTAADAELPRLALLTTRGRAKASMRVPMAWLRKLSQEGSARLEGSVPPAAALDAFIDGAVGEGYLVRDGDDVRSSVDFSAGSLTVNGKALPGAGKPP